jgi:hypothetical protein
LLRHIFVQWTQPQRSRRAAGSTFLILDESEAVQRDLKEGIARFEADGSDVQGDQPPWIGYTPRALRQLNDLREHYENLERIEPSALLMQPCPTPKTRSSVTPTQNRRFEKSRLTTPPPQAHAPSSNNRKEVIQCLIV